METGSEIGDGHLSRLPANTCFGRGQVTTESRHTVDVEVDLGPVRHRFIGLKTEMRRLGVVGGQSSEDFSPSGGTVSTWSASRSCLVAICVDPSMSGHRSVMESRYWARPICRSKRVWCSLSRSAWQSAQHPWNWTIWSTNREARVSTFSWCSARSVSIVAVSSCGSTVIMSACGSTVIVSSRGMSLPETATLGPDSTVAGGGGNKGDGGMLSSC